MIEVSGVRSSWVTRRDELRFDPLDLLALGDVADDAAEEHVVVDFDLGDGDLEVDRPTVSCGAPSPRAARR